MSQRELPDDAEFQLMADDDIDVSRYYFDFGSAGDRVSVPAPNPEVARQLATDEFPSEDPETFELVTDLCEHGKPVDGTCLACADWFPFNPGSSNDSKSVVDDA